MEKEIDFTDCQVLKKASPYMRCSNSTASEYIGSHIYEALGIPAQKTILGTYRLPSEDVCAVCACGDPTDAYTVLQNFAAFRNTVLDSPFGPYSLDLASIEDVFRKEHTFDQQALKDRFWDMFIVDALIANDGRRNDSWGFLYNTVLDELTLAPIYGCGQCLYPEMEPDEAEKVLSDPDALDALIRHSKSALRINGKLIRYFSCLGPWENPDCIRALDRIYPRIDMNAINGIVDDAPYISDQQKEFYKAVLNANYDQLTFQYSFSGLTF